MVSFKDWFQCVFLFFISFIFKPCHKKINDLLINNQIRSFFFESLLLLALLMDYLGLSYVKVDKNKISLRKVEDKPR